MHQEVHISGTVKNNNPFIDPFIHLLDTFDIHTNHPMADEYSFYINSEHPSWHHYDTELARYEVIKNAPFHVLFNDAAITEKVACEIAYAMVQEKPILMVGTPRFSSKITSLLKEVILSNVTHFHSVPISDLATPSTTDFIETAQSTEYALSSSEKALIQSRVKAHFRHLLEEARDIYVQR